MLGCRWTVAIGTPSRSCAMRAPNAMPDEATTVSASACRSMCRYTSAIAGRMARRAMTSNPLRGCQRSGSAIAARASSIVPDGRNPTPWPSINSWKSGLVRIVARCPRLLSAIPRATTGWTSPALPMVGRSTLSDRVVCNRVSPGEYCSPTRQLPYAACAPRADHKALSHVGCSGFCRSAERWSD